MGLWIELQLWCRRMQLGCFMAKEKLMHMMKLSKYALNQLKEMMTEKINHRDTTNYKQPIISASLKDIERAQIKLVQLSLF